MKKVLFGLVLTLTVMNVSARWSSDALMSSQEAIDALKAKKIIFKGIPCDINLVLNSPVHSVNTVIQDIQGADRELCIWGDRLIKDYSAEKRVDFSFEGSAPFNLVISSPFRYEGTLYDLYLGNIGTVYVSPSPQGPFRGSTIDGVFHNVISSPAFQALPQDIKGELLGAKQEGLDYLKRGFAKRIGQLKGKKAIYSVWPKEKRDKLTILPGAPLPKAKPAQPVAKKTAVSSKAPVKVVAKVAPQPKAQNAAKAIAKPVTPQQPKALGQVNPGHNPELKNVIRALGKVAVKAGLQPKAPGQANVQAKPNVKAAPQNKRAPVAAKMAPNIVVKAIPQPNRAPVAVKAPANIAKPVARAAVKAPVKVIAKPVAKPITRKIVAKLPVKKVIARPVAKKPVARVAARRIIARPLAKKPVARIATKAPARRIIARPVAKKPMARVALRAPIKRRP